MIYELYINDILVDLDENTSINLLYKSPIFGDLNSIQSNRSYNVSLPLTITNKKAIDMSHRVDSTSRLPYDYIPAKLYANSVPIFETGFAVITSVAETISLTLTWGNIDNFKGLFEGKLADLFEDNPEYIEWNADSFNNPTTYMRFFEYNSGVKDSSAPLKYLHPCANLQAIIAKIESVNDLQFPDRVKRLAEQKPWLLLTNLNNDENVAFLDSRASTSGIKMGVYLHPIFTGDKYYLDGEWVDKTQDNFDILKVIPLKYPHDNHSFPVVITKGYSKIRFTAKVDERILVQGNEGAAQQTKILVSEGKDYGDISTEIISINPEYAPSSTAGYYDVWFRKDIDFVMDISEDSEYIAIYYDTSLNIYAPFDGRVSNTVIKASVYNEKVSYPSDYPLSSNLPDMTQGELISEFMTYNGLFAYPNQDNPNQIDFFSVNDIYDKRDAGEALDWSDKLLLNEMGELSMADDMSYETFDYAQSNTLDYDNDDDVVAKTEGTITVANKRLDREQELFKSKFSASMMSGGQVYAPLYSLGENGEVSDETIKERIVVSDEAETAISFPAEAYFGGDNGIVADEYERLHELIQNSRILTFRFKLSMLDIKAARFETPIYLNQFEAYFVLYSLTTSTSGICEVELIKM